MKKPADLVGPAGLIRIDRLNQVAAAAPVLLRAATAVLSAVMCQ
jgi:hypothetical protein